MSNLKDDIKSLISANRLPILEVLKASYDDLGEEKSGAAVSINTEEFDAELIIKFHTRQGAKVTKTGLDRHEVTISSMAESGIQARDIKNAVIDEIVLIVEELGRNAGLKQQTEEKENAGNRLEMNLGEFGVAISEDYVRVACFNEDYPKMAEALEGMIEKEKAGPERHINPRSGRGR